jgi:hypothetical protein
VAMKPLSAPMKLTSRSFCSSFTPRGSRPRPLQGGRLCMRGGLDFGTTARGKWPSQA